MLSPIKTMFLHFPLRAYSTVAVLIAVCVLAFLRIREECRRERLDKRRGAALWLLIFYVLLLLFFTVLGRRTLDYYRYNFHAGYSYRQVLLEGDLSLAPQITVNIAMFLPVGFLAALAAKRHGFLKGLFFGVMLTFSIELLQLLLRNGTCEIDDLISNTLGTLAGCVIAIPLRLHLFPRTDHSSAVNSI